VIKYIKEIYNRIFLIFLVAITASLICYLYKEVILFIILQSHKYDFFDLSLNNFIFTDVMEFLLVYFKLIKFIVVQITFFYFVYHVLLFFIPAFFKAEYFFVIFIIKVFICFWFFYLFFFSYILIPVTWNFFLSFPFVSNISMLNVYFESKLIEYINFYITVYYTSLIYFQFLILVSIFFYLISDKFFFIKKFRKLFYYFFVFISTFFSPPDVFSQLVISLILIFAYEFLVIFQILKL